MLFNHRFYFSAPTLTCFDNEQQTPPAGENQQTPPAGESKKGSGLFTQDEVNSFLAKERRALQAKVDELSSEVTKSKSQSSEALTQKIEELSLSLKTTEEQNRIKLEKKDKEASEKMGAVEKERDTYRKELLDYIAVHALTSAAVAAEAFNPEQVVELLRSKTEVGPDRKVQIKGLHLLEDGQPSLHETPEKAIEWMREQSGKYGNLFKSNVVGGVGSNSATGGLTPGKDGRLDMSKMTPEQYRKAKKETPELLGFHQK